MRKIVVTGASGFVAKNVRKYLSNHDFEIISISRRNFKKVKNETMIISPSYNEKDLLPHVKGSSALIHLVGIGKQTIHNDFNLINFEFTKKIVNLCKKAGIKKIIFTSGLGVSKNTTLGYFISKYKSEIEIINSKIDYTIFRPSYIIGKDDYLTKSLKKQIQNTQILVPGSGNFTIQPISIDDVTKIFLKALTDNRFTNKIIDLVGPEAITYQKYVKMFAKKFGVKTKKISLEKVYYEAISNPSGIFDIDDLNLLVGNFKGDHTQLENLSKVKFKTVKEILDSCSLS